MPAKRKSDAIEQFDNSSDTEFTPEAGSSKAPRLSEKDNASSASKAKAKAAPKSWKDVTLEGEDEGDVTVYDDCNEIRRKIRLLQKEPGFKVTYWLKEIGGVNSNSFNRFMKLSGPQGGAENSTYRAAYIFFEKKRIAENKPKTAKRKTNEAAGGCSMTGSHRGQWVFTG
ncbi:hypothetical protein C8J56DRAFT_969719 [Mycena floridula]|nr:hypothetical protein C8J56DRAFT_969719 [Mycena floridula]